MKYIYLLFLPLGLMAQFDYKPITGSVIVDDWNSGRPIDIWIRSTQQKAQSWMRLGESFSIVAQKYDTLVFESDFTKKRKIVINERIWERGELVVHLVGEQIELKALELDNFQFTGYLKEDLEQIAYVDSSEMVLESIGFYDWEQPYVVSPLKEPTDENIVPNSITLLSVGLHPRGHYRRKRNLERYLKADLSYRQILDYYGSDYFEKELGLAKRYHRDFVIYLFTQSGFRALSQKKDYLSIENFMKQKIKPFREIIEPPTTPEAQNE